MDTFEDGLIDSAVWTVFSRDGQITEDSGFLNFVLDKPVSGSSYAGVRLIEKIAPGADFRITANINYSYQEVNSLGFGILVHEVVEAGERFVSGFMTNSSNTMGIFSSGTIEPVYDFVLGSPIGEESFRMVISYTSSDRLFEYSVEAGGNIVGTLTHSISGDLSSDLPYNWNLSDSSWLGIEIVAESLSQAIPTGIVRFEDFELASIPEPRYTGLFVLGVIFILFPIRRFPIRTFNSARWRKLKS